MAFNIYSLGKWYKKDGEWKKIRGRKFEQYEKPDKTKKQHILLELLWIMILQQAQVDERLNYLSEYYNIIKDKIISAEVPVTIDIIKKINTKNEKNHYYKLPDISVYRNENKLKKGKPSSIFEIKTGNHFRGIGKYREYGKEFNVNLVCYKKSWNA